LALWCKLFAGS